MGARSRSLWSFDIRGLGVWSGRRLVDFRLRVRCSGSISCLGRSTNFFRAGGAIEKPPVLASIPVFRPHPGAAYVPLVRLRVRYEIRNTKIRFLWARVFDWSGMRQRGKRSQNIRPLNDRFRGLLRFFFARPGINPQWKNLLDL